MTALWARITNALHDERGQVNLNGGLLLTVVLVLAAILIVILIIGAVDVSVKGD